MFGQGKSTNVTFDNVASSYGTKRGPISYVYECKEIHKCLPQEKNAEAKDYKRINENDALASCW
jgi:hypothetical protein